MLCGIHLPLPAPPAPSGPFELVEFMESYERSTHGLLLEYNEEKELRQTHEDIKRDSYEYDSEMWTGLLL
jgi:hypothetical protein